VRSVACPDCEVVVYDLRREGLDAAQRYGVTSVPTVVVDGRIIGSTVGGKVTEAELKAAGVSALS
jgi:protein-disulfide isomerase